MIVIKRSKILIALVVTFIMLSGSVGAQNYEVPGHLQSYGAEIYREARSYFGGRSFNGYCGTYVRCQLRAMGVFEGQFDFRGNGNQWYSNFENVTQTSGGYYVYRESGADCMKKLAENYGNDIENIVLSFPVQAGYSAEYPGAGHALVIYRLCDGIAYYSESFGFGDYSEGEVIAEDIDFLVERYSKRHGELLGCVLLSPVRLSDDMPAFPEYSFFGAMSYDMMEHISSVSNVMFIAEKFTTVSTDREA